MSPRLLALAALVAATVPLRAVTPPAELARTVYLMGTRATLVTFDQDRERGLARLERLLESLERTEAELSTWKPGSAVSRLNRTPVGAPVTLAPALCAVFRQLDYWTRETSGAFDPAIGALAQAWGLHDDEPRVPGAGELRSARARAGWDRLGFDAGRCTMTRRAAVTIDVGAFGKGEALDRVAADLEGDEAPWLADLGGQVGVRGAPPSGSWRVDIAHPADRARPVLHVDLTSGGLATSGGSERDAAIDGRRIGHILDPRTGVPALFTGSVTVWHEAGLAADVLSTALYVMGPDDGLPWAQARGIAACFLIDHGGGVDVRATAAFRSKFLAHN